MIEVVDALCGAGKTYALTRYAHRLARLGRRVLVVQPSCRLIDATVAGELTCLQPVVRHRVIHSENHPGAVLSEIIATMAAPADGGEIVFVTHAAFLALAYHPRKSEWTVICDEIPAADVFEAFNVPETHDIVTPSLDADEYDDRYCILRPVYPEGERALRKIARNEGRDDVWRLFSGIANRIMSKHWTVYALDYQLQNLRAGVGECRQLITYSLMRPTILEGFDRVILAGACAKDSLLYQLWSAEGVEFRDLALPLRYTRHEHGQLITIRYAVDGSWSKHLRDREHRGVTVMDRIVKAAGAAVGDQPFAYMANKDTPDPFNGRATRLPNTPHGLNDYQDHHAVVVLSALNAPPPHFAFLASKGIDGEAVKDAGMRQTVYQAVNRISIRNPEDRSPKMVVVPDANTAHWLADLFPGAKIERLAGFTPAPDARPRGRPQEHASAKERRSEFKKSRKMELLLGLDVLNGTQVVRGHYPDVRRLVDQNEPQDGGRKDLKRGVSVPHFRIDPATSYGSAFADKETAQSFGDFDLDSDDDFIDLLRWCARRDLASKDEALLISPATFDPSKSSLTSRGLANVDFLRGIYIDFDGGDLLPAEFVRYFPRLRIVTMNTYSSTPENVRWRAFIPTTHAMPIEVHRATLDRIISVLNLEGYWDDDRLKKDKRIKSRLRHGIDMGKRTASSLFYLPCQAADRAASFFEDHRDGLRGPLDPYHWAERCIDLGEPPAPIPPPRPKVTPDAPVSPAAARSREERIEAACEDWRLYGAAKGAGNAAFMSLAGKLKWCGLDEGDLSARLYQEAGHAHSPGDRRRDIRRIVRYVMREGATHV